MRVLEEPFTTRDAILAVLRPGQPSTESPFRTLRTRDYASAGLRIDVRTVRGHVLGRSHLYSSLNADAARAVRLREAQVARELAARAQELERSAAATLIRDAAQAAAASMTRDPLDATAPVALQQYVQLRRRSSVSGLDHHAIAREWFVHSAAWLGRDEDTKIGEAVAVLAQAAAEARTELLDERLRPVSTFFGIVRRMDSSAAEVEGADGTRLVPRDDLDRAGLSILGQAVALLCEALPSGGSLVLPMPAVALEVGSPPTDLEVWDLEEMDDGATVASIMEPADRAWLERGLAWEPTAIPASPIRRG